MTDIEAFVRESNHIEGIRRAPTIREVVATAEFNDLAEPSTDDLRALLAVYQPDAVLRDSRGLDVRVGNHIAPRGGAGIALSLRRILHRAREGDHPYIVHCEYETLHPFTDGNGRTGRALWLWQMTRQQGGAPLGFLHHWYYQSLEFSEARR